MSDDTISRDAAIDAIFKTCRRTCTLSHELEKAFERLPSAQPHDIARDIATIIENEKDMRVMLKNAQPDVPDTNGGDIIYRRAAIDAIKTWGLLDGLSEGQAIEILADEEKLPSVQPEQRWIPCSERLPEESGRYIVSVLDGIDRRTTVAPYQTRCKAWTMTGRMAYWKVIAWMPLPEPYKGEQE